MSAPVTHLCLLSRKGLPKMLYSTSELPQDLEKNIISTAFPDKEVKGLDYVYFIYDKYYCVSVSFSNHNEWENKEMALVAVCSVPCFHQISINLCLLAKSYLLQTVEINNALIASYVTLLNTLYKPVMMSSPTATSLLNRLDNNFLSLLKLFLLEYKVLVVASKDQAAIVSDTILFFLSIIPRLLMPVTENDEMRKLCLPINLNNNDRPVYLHLSLDNMELISKGKGVFAGMTNDFVLQKSPDYDVVVDLSNNKIITNNKRIMKACQLTKTDKAYVYDLKEKLLMSRTIPDGIASCENWLLNEMTEYVLSVLHGLCRVKELFNGKSVTKKMLEEVENDFGKEFIEEFLQTSAYDSWRKNITESGFIGKESYDRVHPAFSGKINTDSEESLKSIFHNEFFISNAVMVKGFNDYFNSTVKRKFKEASASPQEKKTVKDTKIVMQEDITKEDIEEKKEQIEKKEEKQEEKKEIEEEEKQPEPIKDVDEVKEEEPQEIEDIEKPKTSNDGGIDQFFA